MRWFLLFGCVWLGSCRAEKTPDELVLLKRNPVDRSYQGLVGQELGAPCDPDSNSCASLTDGACIKFGHEVSAGFACSRRCASDVDCGTSFKCNQIIPSEMGWYCTPEVAVQ